MRRVILWLDELEPLDIFLGCIVLLCVAALLFCFAAIVGSVRGHPEMPQLGDFLRVALFLAAGGAGYLSGRVLWPRAVAWAKRAPTVPEPPGKLPEPDSFLAAAQREVEELTREP